MEAIANAITTLTVAAQGGAGGRFLPDLLIGAGVLVLCVWALASVRKKLSRRVEQAALTPGERIASVRSRAAGQERVESLMADAEELTRRLAAHLDNKAARLERLIAAADERLARLEESTGAAPGARRRHHVRTIGADDRAESASVTTLLDQENDPLTRRVHALADDGLTTIEIAQRLEEQVGKVELILALRRS